jgi:hypothetical protein
MIIFDSASQTTLNSADTIETLTGLLLDDKKDDNPVKYYHFNKMTLAGDTTYFFNVSADDKENWINGIFHNSRYAIFSFDSDSKLSLISKGLDMPKFRKCKIKDVLDISIKIKKYFDNI